MSSMGAHEVETQPRISRGRTAGIRARLAHDFAKAHGRDPITPQLDWLERVARWIGTVPAKEHREIRRTVEQIVIALGLPYDGTVKGARDRYKNPIYRTLESLERMGWLENGHEPLWEPNGEGRCIVVRPAAGVAQSVRQNLYGGGVPPRRRAPGGCEGSSGWDPRDGRQPFFSGHLSPPSRERTFPSVKEIPSPANGGASARVTGDHESPYERFLVHAAQRRSLVRATGRASLAFAEGGVERVGVELPGLAADAPVVPLARELLQLALPDVSPAISAKRAAQLEAAASRIDHYAGRPGAWVEQACVILGCWSDGELAGRLSEPPRSLGALAIELRCLANTWRFYALERKRERLRPLAAARERQKVKRWRIELRALEHRSPGAGRGLRRPRDV